MKKIEFTEGDAIFMRVVAELRDRRLDWSGLSAALGLSSQRVYNWRKRGTIPADMHAAVAEFLGCSLDYLVTGRRASEVIYSRPPSNAEWDRIPSKGRMFITLLVTLSLSGAIDDPDFDMLDNMTRRMVGQAKTNFFDKPTLPNGAGASQWLTGDPPNGSDEVQGNGTK